MIIKAIHLADLIDGRKCTYGDIDEAADELRRLHQSESEGWRYANELEQERRRLYDVNAELLKAVKYIANCCQLSLDNPKFRIDETSCDLIRTAIAKATGEQYENKFA